MNVKKLQANGLLLIAAIIWGMAFAAQRVGMEYMEPFTFNGIRFALGSLSLIPLIVVLDRQKKSTGITPPDSEFKPLVLRGLIAGLFLFSGASLQQIGIVYTTAGNAGFITGLYVVMVPLLGLFWGQMPDTGTWVGAALAAVGLYFLCITDSFTIAHGDLLVFIGAFFWAGHVLVVGAFSRNTDPIKLAFIQFVCCSVFSMITAVTIETITLDGIRQAAIPIFYGGVGSVGIAFTLQVVGQRHGDPAHAAIILSLECAFAALGGWLFLNEILSPRSFMGCCFMFSGMVLSQAYPYLKRFMTDKA